MMKTGNPDLKKLLDELAELYNRPAFIESDPICIPHQYSRREDIEIAGFLTAAISWGNRKMILRNAKYMMQLLDDSPFEFVSGASEKEMRVIGRFVHRTFNSTDFIYFLRSLQNIYVHKGGLENVFMTCQSCVSLKTVIHEFHEIFFELPHEKRTQKHVSDPFRGSAAKKLNMFLRWMVRKDDCGVDFGIWENISPSQLFIPLDLHAGNTARKLGLLERKQNDWKAVEELTGVLRTFDPDDPVKYDFALFGAGVSKSI